MIGSAEIQRGECLRYNPLRLTYKPLVFCVKILCWVSPHAISSSQTNNSGKSNSVVDAGPMVWTRCQRL